MDKITTAFLTEFKKEYSLTKLDDKKAFEHFANFLVLSDQYSETFDTADVSVNDDSLGIDGIAIIVNGALVTSADEVDDLAKTNGYLEVSFIFTQAKTSSNFDSAAVGQMEFAISDFFKEKPKIKSTPFVKNSIAISNAIFKTHVSKLTKSNPTCKLYYITTGKWVDDAVLTARAETVTETLKGLNIFSGVTFNFVDADRIHKLYRATKNSISRDFTFSEKVVLPDIENVSEAYLGLLPSSEFLKLIENDSGDIIKGLFYDNVRDWQEYNPVNNEIRETLENDKTRSRFSIMNNGVTIIAKILRATGNKFHISDYQIVNGCQTSHVIHDQRDSLTGDDAINIPIRIISTKDDDVINSIIKATNRQTQVEEEQLIALSEFQKKLELFFATFDEKRRLYYERRSRQFAHLTNVEKVRIINIKMLARSFTAAILQEPHRTTRSYKTILDRVGKNIFSKNDKPEPYYTVAYCLYKLEFFFRNEEIDSKFKIARYQVIMAFFHLASEGIIPKTNSKDILSVCDKVNKILWDEKNALGVFKKSIDFVERAATKKFDRDGIHSQPFTDKLKAMLMAVKPLTRTT